MVSSTDVGGDKPNSKANWKKNKPKPRNQVLRFYCDTTSDTVLHIKVITNRSNQDGQIIALCKSFPSHIASEHYPDWTDSFRTMTRKTRADFIPTSPTKRAYGADNAHGDFQWRVPALDTEEEYNSDRTIWDRSLAAGIKRYRDYVNNGDYIFLVIQGQVEPSL